MQQQPKYLPQIVRGKIKIPFREWTEYRAELTGQGYTVNNFKAMQKADQYFNTLELFLSSWSYDQHSCWHLWNWNPADDERVMLALYHAEQYKPGTIYKDDFRAFRRDWEAGEYDPGATYTFKLDQVEVLEVLQEEVDNVDHEKVKKAVARAKEKAHRRRAAQKKHRRKRK